MRCRLVCSLEFGVWSLEFGVRGSRVYSSRFTGSRITVHDSRVHGFTIHDNVKMFNRNLTGRQGKDNGVKFAGSKDKEFFIIQL